jgi:hypothetical protein
MGFKLESEPIPAVAACVLDRCSRTTRAQVRVLEEPVDLISQGPRISDSETGSTARRNGFLQPTVIAGNHRDPAGLGLDGRHPKHLEFAVGITKTSASGVDDRQSSSWAAPR